MEFHENPSSGKRVVPWGRTDGRRPTDMTKLVVTFLNFANTKLRGCLYVNFKLKYPQLTRFYFNYGMSLKNY
jgi:hypothetical protein